MPAKKRAPNHYRHHKLRLVRLSQGDVQTNEAGQQWVLEPVPGLPIDNMLRGIESTLSKFAWLVFVSGPFYAPIIHIVAQQRIVLDYFSFYHDKAFLLFLKHFIDGESLLRLDIFQNLTKDSRGLNRAEHVPSVEHRVEAEEHSQECLFWLVLNL